MSTTAQPAEPRNDLLNEPPFFIVGMGRSGTTLLRSLLGAHSRIAVTPETHFMTRADNWGAQNRDAPEDFDDFWRNLITWSRFREMGIDPDDVLARIDASGKRDFRNIFTAMLAAYGETIGKPRVGEKTPGHYVYLDRIFAWFPQARIIAIRRDPRDVVASHVNAPWITDQMARKELRAPVIRRLRTFHVAERARVWCEANGEILPEAESDPRILIVVYEKLVSHPEREMRRICDFLGEPFEASAASERRDDPLVPTTDKIRSQWSEWNEMHDDRASAPVSTGSVGRWRERLSPEEASLVETICGPVMTRQGYRTEMPKNPRRLVGQALLHAGLAEDKLRTFVDWGKKRLKRAL